MNSPVAFLGLAVVLSLIGFGVLWLMQRQPRKPKLDNSVHEFSRNLSALAPEQPDQPGQPLTRPGQRRATPPPPTPSGPQPGLGDR